MTCNTKLPAANLLPGLVLHSRNCEIRYIVLSATPAVTDVPHEIDWSTGKEVDNMYAGIAYMPAEGEVPMAHISGLYGFLSTNYHVAEATEDE